MTDKILRLHITPFSKDLAQSLIAAHPDVAPGSISYHFLECFPESTYGYIDLPFMEAEKVKRKLNGSILKGKRLRVEDARPRKRRVSPDKEAVIPSPVLEEAKQAKKSKRTNAELQGHELGPERRVKRGWTQPGQEKRPKSSRVTSSVPSKYTDKQECLFRAGLLLHKAENEFASPKRAQTSTKQNKTNVIIHEFEKSASQPTFLRQEEHDGKKGVAMEYIDGQGWVDRDGNVIEQVNERGLRPRNRAKRPEAEPVRAGSRAERAQASPNNEKTHRTEEAAEGDQGSDASVAAPDSETSNDAIKARPKSLDDDTSSSGSSYSASEPDSGSGEEEGLHSTTGMLVAQSQESVTDAPKTSASANPDVHPLEALFKRPKQAASQINGKRPLEIKTSFSFFGPNEGQTIPQTPFTTRDLQQRGLRSAAPTPDTAHPTRRFFAESASPNGNVEDDDKIELAESSNNGDPSTATNEHNGESEFSKWFWEHRGENNRTWKRRRREAMKEKRQRETRQRGRKIG